jgi:hypothetical protein
MFNVWYKIPFQTLNSNAAVGVKYLISPNYYIQIIKLEAQGSLYRSPDINKSS